MSEFGTADGASEMTGGGSFYSEQSTPTGSNHYRDCGSALEWQNLEQNKLAAGSFNNVIWSQTRPLDAVAESKALKPENFTASND